MPGNVGMVLKNDGFPVYVKGGKGLDKTVGSHVLFEGGEEGAAQNSWESCFL